MVYLHLLQTCKILFLCLVISIVSACAALDKPFGPEEDPAISALQRDTERLSRSNAATQNAVKDLYQKVDTLEARLGDLDEQVREIADREPILITPGGNGPSAAVQEMNAAPSAVETPPTEPTIRQQPPEPLPKKRADLVKKLPDSKPPAPEPADPMAKDTYEKAYGAYQDGRFDEALALFKMFLKKHPSHDLSDNAQYWIGEIYYDIENFPEAILAFKEVAARFPQENKAPHALLKIGYSYMALDDPVNARTFFQRVIKNYPFSDAEAMAQAKLEELERLPR